MCPFILQISIEPYYEPGTVLGFGVTAVNKTDQKKISVLMELNI